uniref:Uncharacterized protein n=1 Tax=Knipowitschia caucasica TaxID=637954 RepID=A0AAV2J494_KNICA
MPGDLGKATGQHGTARPSARGSRPRGTSSTEPPEGPRGAARRRARRVGEQWGYANHSRCRDAEEEQTTSSQTEDSRATRTSNTPVESDRDDLSVAGVQPFKEEKELEVLEKRHSDLWLNEKRANNLEDSVIEFDEDLASDPLDSEYVPPISLSAALHTERQVLAEFNQITSSKLGNDFVEALDCLTTQFIKLFKAKRGSAGAKLSKIVRHLDSCQRRWGKEKGTHQKRWWNCRKTLVTERSLKIIIL